MPLHIEDDATAALVAELAKATGVTESEAVRAAVTAELRRLEPESPLREKLAALRASHPLPPPTGLKADKAFFDDLSGD